MSKILLYFCLEVVLRHAKSQSINQDYSFLRSMHYSSSQKTDCLGAQISERSALFACECVVDKSKGYQTLPNREIMVEKSFTSDNIKDNPTEIRKHPKCSFVDGTPHMDYNGAVLFLPKPLWGGKIADVPSKVEQNRICYTLLVTSEKPRLFKLLSIRLNRRYSGDGISLEPTGGGGESTTVTLPNEKPRTTKKGATTGATRSTITPTRKTTTEKKAWRGRRSVPTTERYVTPSSDWPTAALNQKSNGYILVSEGNARAKEPILRGTPLFVDNQILGIFFLQTPNGELIFTAVAHMREFIQNETVSFKTRLAANFYFLSALSFTYILPIFNKWSL